MRKLVRASMILGLCMLPFSLMAEEAPRYPMNMGPGYHMMGPGNYEFCDECGTYHMRGHYDGDKTIQEKEAREKFEVFVKKHLKGFTITKMASEKVPMGTMYWAIIEDKNGNQMELHMNPWGYIRGPFIR
ncbi:hypothetical protein PGH07_05290 [Sulfurovum sp. zt1-1]|uniref:Uncharacterized protein n=1 Tax=Sulfurovum zhangzhouensis TaxID=3019067 RepID=A0ABT7QZB5_9BACT|nr:hypothetical protein [Sulfurovum zhangzhouensis]MDM5271581.1 hypothetical protein [Sulfurovum zhangzhouensis]